MVLDADLGLANVDIMLGIRSKAKPRPRIGRRECELKDAIVEGPHGIKIIPATSGTQSDDRTIARATRRSDSSVWYA